MSGLESKGLEFLIPWPLAISAGTGRDFAPGIQPFCRARVLTVAHGQQEEAFQAGQDLCPVFVLISVKSRADPGKQWGNRVISAFLCVAFLCTKG